MDKANIDPKLTEGVDYTIDSPGRFVFTAQYHLKRGYCCEHGCLNCPYQNLKEDRAIGGRAMRKL